MTSAAQESDVAIDRCFGNRERLRQSCGRKATSFNEFKQTFMPFCDSETPIVRHVLFPHVYQESIDMPRREGKNNRGTRAETYCYAAMRSSLWDSVANFSPIAFSRKRASAAFLEPRSSA